MRKIFITCMALCSIHFASAQIISSRSIIKVKDITKQEQKKTTEQAEAERITTKKEAEKQAAENQRIAEEKEAERLRMEAERRAIEKEAERIIAEKEAERARAESERIAAEKEAKKKRIAAEKATEREQFAKTEVRRGYGQSVNISYSYNVDNFIGVSYIGGYHFNKMLLLGLGAGANLTVSSTSIENFCLIDLAQGNPYKLPTDFEEMQLLPRSKINVPIYLYFKANLLKGRVSPYISTSIGGRISPKLTVRTNDYLEMEYYQSGVFADIIVGGNIFISEKTELYLGIGYRIESFLYANYANRISNYTNKFSHGLNAQIGVMF